MKWRLYKIKKGIRMTYFKGSFFTCLSEWIIQKGDGYKLGLVKKND